MSAKRIKYMWAQYSFCNVCEERDAHCDCPPEVKGTLWYLFVEGANMFGCVTQFDSNGPYYGTWTGGRSGAMNTLKAAQVAVVRAVVLPSVGE